MIFNMSLIIFAAVMLKINWNLTLINLLGIFVAVNYASTPYQSFEPWRERCARVCQMRRFFPSTDEDLP
jgi:ABC-type bacteriocin/lantibiotic exporter with double-glycine peptidase domain